MLRPGRTYYVSLKGDDQADGLSWRTAWRRIRNSVAKLGPGDTLLVDEGEYYEGTCVAKRSGEVDYRRKGETQWSVAPEPSLGTVHAVGLADLSVNADYEFRVMAKHLRGRDNESGPHSFRTPSHSRDPLSFYVAPDGDDARDGLAHDRAWRTLRKAGLEAQAGDTVLLAPGTYHDALEPVSRGRPITFRRQGNGAVLLRDGGVDRMLIKLEGKRHIIYEGITFARTRQMLKS